MVLYSNDCPYSTYVAAIFITMYPKLLSQSTCTNLHILYSGKHWWDKTLANSAF